MYELDYREFILREVYQVFLDGECTEIYLVLDLRYTVERGQSCELSPPSSSICDYCRAPIKSSCTMQPSISSISPIGRSSRAVETTAADLDKASENWDLTFQIQQGAPHHARWRRSSKWSFYVYNAGGRSTSFNMCLAISIDSTTSILHEVCILSLAFRSLRL